MTLKEQRLAIAELLRFKKEVGCTGIIRWRKGDELFDKLPDYLNDLNAMHEAEKVLTKDQIETFCGIIAKPNHGIWWAIHATAAQRAEAFLKTFNLWTDDT